MSTQHDSHGGHETEDFQGTYAVWAVPFSLMALVAFLVIVALWAPAAASREMRAKELQGAEGSRSQLLEHRAHESQVLASGAVPVEQAMRDLATGK
jgi:flagellar biosynthesis/type III secretory pathway M-ring protein FliF/YscJ